MIEAEPIVDFLRYEYGLERADHARRASDYYRGDDATSLVGICDMELEVVERCAEAFNDERDLAMDVLRILARQFRHSPRYQQEWSVIE